MENVLLKMNNISKFFPGVVALDDIEFDVKTGEVHALMGENGAGKSTLIKIISGVHQSDEGEMFFEGRRISPKSVHESGLEGISTIFQELNLIPFASISENIFVGHYPKKAGRVQWKQMHKEAQVMMEEVGVHVDVREELSKHSTAIQQMVAIVRAIHMEAKLLIMDEPTSSLDAKETNMLFNIIRQLQAKGIAVIFISHRLDEIFEVSDRITVLKDGKYVGTCNKNEIDKLGLIKMMVGRELDHESVRQHATKEFDPNIGYQCELCDIQWKNKLKNINFKIRKGEILGLAGLLGSGRTESVRLLFGCDVPDSGKILFNGKRIHLRTPVDAVKRKVAFCTENRRIEGIIPNMTIEDNIAIASISKFTGAGGFINKNKKKKNALDYIEELRIKTPGHRQLIKNLSGGNQQKVLLARWLCTQPDLIILDEPTRGIDVGAKSEIEKLINKFSEEGISVLMISSELQELVRNCDRVVVIRDGRSVGELENDDISEDNIMAMIAHAAEEEEVAQ